MCTKVCTKCGVEKPISDFIKNITAKDGYTYACKKCINAKRMETVSKTQLTEEECKVTFYQCTQCKETKTLDHFGKRKHSSTGRRTRCKNCECKNTRRWYHSIDEEARQQYVQKHSHSTRNRRIKSKFGIDVTMYDELFEKQNGVCAICGNPQNRKDTKHLSIDHCHTTGNVRALLCNSCNLGIGQFQDNEMFILSAIQYLLNHHQNQWTPKFVLSAELKNRFPIMQRTTPKKTATTTIARSVKSNNA